MAQYTHYTSYNYMKIFHILLITVFSYLLLTNALLLTLFLCSFISEMSLESICQAIMTEADVVTFLWSYCFNLPFYV